MGEKRGGSSVDRLDIDSCRESKIRHYRRLEELVNRALQLVGWCREQLRPHHGPFRSSLEPPIPKLVEQAKFHGDYRRLWSHSTLVLDVLPCG